MAREKVLITVKTYPTLSRRYDEVVCTAGFREDSSWIRIYPVPYRKFDAYQRYKKFQWIELDLVRNSSDRRSESYRPYSEIKLLDRMGTENNWYERRKFILENGNVYTNLAEIIEKNKNGEISLATFKATEILRVTAEPVARNWDKSKLFVIEQRNKQTSFFDEGSTNLKLVEKIPYKFSYEFVDDSGRTSKLMIEDWEIGELYRKLLKKYGDEPKAIEGVQHKYMNELAKGRDTYFFLGTTLEWDAKATNPFLIVGVFYPPKVLQSELF